MESLILKTIPRPLNALHVNRVTTRIKKARLPVIHVSQATSVLEVQPHSSRLLLRMASSALRAIIVLLSLGLKNLVELELTSRQLVRVQPLIVLQRTLTTSPTKQPRPFKPTVETMPSIL